MGFACGSGGKESTCNAGDLGLIPGLGRSPGEGKGYPLQSGGLENSMDYIVHGVAKSWTRLNNFHFDFECSCISWIPTHSRKVWASTKWQKVEMNKTDTVPGFLELNIRNLCITTYMVSIQYCWIRYCIGLWKDWTGLNWWKGQPTPVFLPGKSHGQRSLGGYSPWDGKESDTAEQLSSNSTEWFYIPNTVLRDLSVDLYNPHDESLQ